VETAPYTSDLAAALAGDVLERFLRYVRIDTQSRPNRTGSPSSPGQLELGRLLVSELQAAGLSDAELDENGYVFATLAASGNGARLPVIGLLAHMDTAPDASGAGVEPIVHRHYGGGEIMLPRSKTKLDPAVMPELKTKRGHDIVTGSGDTLLGADDKAGVAEIMAAVSYLATHPELPRPILRIAFTPDEEINEGATLFDIERFGALCAYTLDGSELGEIQGESFSADEIVVRVEGIEVHPGQASGKMVNALRLAAQIIAALPLKHLTPETTSNREGFIHIHQLSGTPGRAEFRGLLRDFDTDKLADYADLVRTTAQEVVGRSPRARVEVEVNRQYRNMLQYIERVPHLLSIAEKAIRAEGIEPLRNSIRGGTDGSRLSERGLPTPNLFTGAHEFHSPREWASAHDMASAAAVIVRLAGVWAERVIPDDTPVGSGG